MAEAARLFDQGRLEQAALLCREVLEADPGDPDALYLLGRVALKNGQAAAAAELIRRAILGEDRRPAYHFHLALALQTMGDLAGAVTSYRNNLALDPDHIEALANLGVALFGLGALDEAEGAYRRLLALAPGDPDMLANFAHLMMARGDAGTALAVLSQSLSLGETDRAKEMFLELVSHRAITGGNDQLRAAMARALAAPWARPGNLANAAAGLIKSGALAPLVAKANRAWPNRLKAEELLGAEGFAPLGRDPLLAALLAAAPNTDITLERFLTLARAALLETACASPAWREEDGLTFAAALARQCFINDYVFDLTDEEWAAACALRDALTAASPPLQVLAVACYVPLHDIPALAGLKGPPALEAVLTQQIAEPREEKRLAAAMPLLAAIADATSRLVRDQYEEHPYPRWVRLPPRPPESIADYLKRNFPLARMEGAREPKDMLVAGCGTGQQSVFAALKFGGANMLAVDLSLASLAHAQRKSRELGLPIQYGQADILNLPGLARRFDVVEAIGVLHHMADPFAGWRALLAVLRPGGFMRLGFYSETARREVASVRARIAARGIAPAGIRRFRQELMADNSAGPDAILLSEDFFSLSACRDLLFHAREHSFRLEQIAAFLEAERLAFIGFDVGEDSLALYRQRFPHDPAALDLANWAVLEQENTSLFAGLYKFWVQKPG
jgi:Flp pilus assembly protein TadD/SAM-dependent methyltransferase